MPRAKHRYHAPGEVKSWMRSCGLKSDSEAAKVIGCSVRTWFRWVERGLPEGLYGDLLVQEMRRIRLKIRAPKMKVCVLRKG